MVDILDTEMKELVIGRKLTFDTVEELQVVVCVLVFVSRIERVE